MVLQEVEGRAEVPPPPSRDQSLNNAQNYTRLNKKEVGKHGWDVQTLYAKLLYVRVPTPLGVSS